MDRFSILTLGCKVNQYESQQIRELLERLGLAAADVTQLPDLVVVNTCCVTHTASAKSRHLVHQALRHGPKAVVVCGCLPIAPCDELQPVEENVHVVKDRSDLAGTLQRLIETFRTTPDAENLGPSSRNKPIRPEKDPKVKRKNDLCPPLELLPLSRFCGQTRAFLKIQDGCDGFCAYCIIPATRPKVHSNAPEKVLAEAEALVGAGHKEIVVTGVHIGAYGQTTVRRRHWPTAENDHLPALLDRLARIDGLARIRVSSLDPADVTARLLEVFARHRNIMPHLHLSLQSGSDRVLHRMCRPYTADDFVAKVELANSVLDRPAITTDIIVGFPGETDADFRRTLDLAQRAGFAKMHVFAFSPRKGTAAARMPEKVPSEVKKERSQVLRDLDHWLQSQFRRRFLGQTAQVLIESADGRPSGRAERYFTVHLLSDGSAAAKQVHTNDLVRVRLIEDTATAVLGVPA
ncbi:MAG TPA: tRNA (N(6)-L-threonylcarbamoyladenosine(37)-C(2))-methylthiotransferase MtaB [Sedimentisphaerales bacterium]|nr:tRNA (N(6)-L-threonylcarbamoyladenosine(37)-C(2))-methylthiotransferase MtaB [Sedimentisphaerales bacterium]HRS10837.1 tRNA (N(6)-L-threonylcarbamoyladenosine(37)-C(2))-methylthiotransferase MtaB [Sedimentisphaerales bacterium]HRV47543.1 tRNA (N(6)-L-threonylcarbamoyladenosine(37)-C(2))-methylthiotransferase MtaB [Sedimentisphaerales bacterium]